MYEKPSNEIVATTDEDLTAISQYSSIAVSHDTGEPRPLRLDTPAVEVPYTFIAGAAKGIRSTFERAANGETTTDEAEILRAQQILQELDKTLAGHSALEVELIREPIKRVAKKVGRRAAALAFGSLNV